MSAVLVSSASRQLVLGSARSCSNHKRRHFATPLISGGGPNPTTTPSNPGSISCIASASSRSSSETVVNPSSSVHLCCSASYVSGAGNLSTAGTYPSHETARSSAAAALSAGGQNAGRTEDGNGGNHIRSAEMLTASALALAAMGSLVLDLGTGQNLASPKAAAEAASGNDDGAVFGFRRRTVRDFVSAEEWSTARKTSTSSDSRTDVASPGAYDVSSCLIYPLSTTPLFFTLRPKVFSYRVFRACSFRYLSADFYPCSQGWKALYGGRIFRGRRRPLRRGIRRSWRRGCQPISARSPLRKVHPFQSGDRGRLPRRRRLG